MIVTVSNVSKRFDAAEVLKDISFSVYEGEFLSLLGPSGCGKSTCLRILAGFEEPNEGEVWIDGKDMKGVPPNKRDVSMVFQDYSLFPHMNVFENVAFGLKERKENKAEIRRKVKDALELVRLPGFESRSPTKLSGGQKQRVAIARSLVLNPKVLLLDEPLGALDLKLRKQMQSELKALQDQVGITFIYVTHDQEEALTMSDRIVVLDKGVIQQVGTPMEIYNTPQSRFVADFIGETTFFNGLVKRAEGNEAIVDIGELHICVSKEGVEIGQAVILSIRPEHVKMEEEALSQRNLFQGRVVGSTYKGATVEYTVSLSNGQQVRATANARGRLPQQGDQIHVGWGVEQVVVIQ